MRNSWTCLPLRSFRTQLRWREGTRAALLAALWFGGCLHKAPRAALPPATAASAAPAAPAARVRKTAANNRTIEPVPAPAPQWLGKVKVIGAHGGFVLIETPSALVTAAVPAGSVLHCHPPGVTAGPSTADLRVSPERRPPFLVADVLAGQPTVGDGAYYVVDALPAPNTLIPATPGLPISSVLSAPPDPTPSATP